MKKVMSLLLALTMGGMWFRKRNGDGCRFQGGGNHCGRGHNSRGYRSGNSRKGISERSLYAELCFHVGTDVGKGRRIL